MPLEKIGELRQRLGPLGGPPYPPAFLKPSDEQSVIALAAVLQAIERSGQPCQSFTRWGVIAAPRFLARVNGAETIHRFDTGGAWKVSPLFVAHRSLHAVSGTISQALQIHGPNFAVGGGRHAVAEALLTALSLLEDRELPGLWVALSQCEPEPQPDRQGINSVPSVCQGLALSLIRAADNWQGLRLSLQPSAGSGTPCPALTSADAPFTRLHQFLEKDPSRSSFGTWTCPLNWGHELRLSDEH
jgi:hypothetical protein